MGWAPTTIRKLRQKIAVTGGYFRQGGCTTTALFLTAGMDKNPEIFIRNGILASWAETLGKSQNLQEAINKVWRSTVERLEGGPPANGTGSAARSLLCWPRSAT